MSFHQGLLQTEYSNLIIIALFLFIIYAFWDRIYYAIWATARKVFKPRNFYVLINGEYKKVQEAYQIERKETWISKNPDDTNSLSQKLISVRDTVSVSFLDGRNITLPMSNFRAGSLSAIMGGMNDPKLFIIEDQHEKDYYENYIKNQESYINSLLKENRRLAKSSLESAKEMSEGIGDIAKNLPKVVVGVTTEGHRPPQQQTMTE